MNRRPAILRHWSQQIELPLPIRLIRAVIIGIVVGLVVLWTASAAQWENTQWNSGVRLKQSPSGFFFVVPQPDGHVNSIVQKRNPVKLRQTATVAFRLKTLSGKPVFKSLDRAEGLKPNFRIMFQRKGDNWACDDKTQHYRWWATGTNCAFLQDSLDKGSLTYSVKIVPANFSNCWGKPATSFKREFKAALSNLDNWQVTWGGGRSFAHGIYTVKGAALYQLIEATIK